MLPGGDNVDIESSYRRRSNDGRSRNVPVCIDDLCFCIHIAWWETLGL